MLPAINTISAYITSDSESFEKSISDLKDYAAKFNVSKPKSEIKKEKPPQSQNYLNRKKPRKEDEAIEEDIMELDKKISEKKMQEENERAKNLQQDQEQVVQKDSIKKEDECENKAEEIPHSSFDLIKIENDFIKFENEDSIDFHIIEEIVSMLKNHFHNKSNEDVITTLFATSFNIENAYLLMSDFDYFKGKLCYLNLDIAYTESDDYILKNLRNSVTYGKLLETKGFDNIEERLNFLS